MIMNVKPLRHFMLPLILLLDHYTNGFVLLVPKHHSSARVQTLHQNTRQSSLLTPPPSSPCTELPMAFRPLDFVSDKLKFAGPLATFGLTLPQLGDLSVENIQRVGETSFATMVGIAALQGALVSCASARARVCACVTAVSSSHKETCHSFGDPFLTC